MGTNPFRRAALALFIGLAACGGTEAPAPPEEPEAPGLKAGKGVDVAGKILRIGTLNDESGPAAAIGKPYANGKRLLAAVVNAGGAGMLPDGWKVELVERDHGYNPQKSVQAFNEIKDQILFVGTSFGTPNTLPLLPHLEKNKLVAYPASLSSQMAENTYTPPLGPSYQVEAQRAMDWIVETAGDAGTVKAGIVYQNDDFGKDALVGWQKAAKHHRVEIVNKQSTAPGQKDFTAVVTGLKDAGATHVLLATLPSASGPILGTAAQLKYMPVWVGNTPAWVDQFFNPEVIPSVVFTNYHQVLGIPTWGEDVPGMDTFLKAWEAHGQDMGSPDFYILASYVQGMIQIEAAKRAIDNGDITRPGYLAAVRSITGWDAGGMIQPVSLSDTPYVAGTRTRILKPDFEKKGWTVVSDYAEPDAKGPGDGSGGGGKAGKGKQQKAKQQKKGKQQKAKGK